MNVQPFRRMDDLRRNKRVRKGMFVLPSLFTAGNIAAGYYAIAQCIQGVLGDYGRFDNAAIAIGFAVLFDGLDGRIARMTNSTSEFGKQLDSLADAITFGVAPGILAYIWGFRFTSMPDGSPDLQTKLMRMGGVVSFLFLTACASRLARFNIQVNPQPSNPGRPGKKYFVGMPTPAGAGIVASIVHLTKGAPITDWRISALWMFLIFAIGYLMVSTWRFYSFKDIDLRGQKPAYTFILVALAVAAIVMFSHQTLFFISMTYMLSGVIARLSYLVKRPHSTPPPQPQS